MKKSTIGIIIGAALLVIAGVAVWMIVSSLGKPITTSSENPNVVDKTNAKEVQVVMHDLSYSPSVIRIKKGTKVTWTNQDSVGHNVVANDAPDTGGIPKSAPLLGRGQSTSVTFSRVGIFTYHCTPHAFMQGSVEVVD
ncbi:MAG TPA: plastocyanin/azurin family copper-binding protein [Candidatus Saccharimonadales bacterium]|nr:plastocyanin/azurin family copper-binding protein [Candidatus Saccharimonadales bacterium]